MKKIFNDELIRLSPVKMYWDNLEEAYEIIAKGRQVEIESLGYSYDSLPELKEKTKKNYINDVKLTARGANCNNFISVNIEPVAVYIHRASESTETAARVKELLAKNSPWYMYSPNFLVWHFLKGLLGTIPVLVIFPLFSSKVENIYLKLVMFLIGLLIFFWTFFDKSIIGRSKIFIFLKKDELSFWERNKDELIRQFIVAIIAFLFGYLAKIS